MMLSHIQELKLDRMNYSEMEGIGIARHENSKNSRLGEYGAES